MNLKILSFAFCACTSGLLLAGCESVGSETRSPAKRAAGAADRFVLNEREYFQSRGVGVMVFEDTYPESHQSGVIMVSHGTRIATNGDLRLEPTPGQWSPVPKLVSREVDHERGEIRAKLSYPDEKQHLVGFNPLKYPDLELDYELQVSAEGDAIHVRVHLEQPLPEEWVGEVGFVMELYPGDLFGKAWTMDEATGIFPRQPYAVQVAEGSAATPEIVASGEMKDLLPLANHRARPAPLATGKRLAVAPESDQLRMVIEGHSGELELLDGRVQHQNGWFVVRSVVAAGATENAIHLTLTPNVISDWVAPPVIQHSMVGYHPAQ